MLNSSINRRPVTAAVRLYIVAALLVLAAPLYALQSSTTVEVPELRALPGHAVPERSEPYMVSQAVARQATSRLLGTVTDNTGNALAGMTIFLSEPFTVEQVNRIQMARRNREAAESDLNSERDKFDRGVSTVRLVLEAEHRLAQAKTDEADIAISVFGTGAQTAKITQTDNAGGFVITGLQPGRYGVRVFSSQTGLSAFANVDIRAGQDLRQDFQIRTAAEKPIATTVSAPLPSAVVSVALELPPPTVTGPDMRAIYTPPRVYSKVDVLFPPEARKVGFQGTEVVRAMIRVDGTLKVQEILQSLDEAFAVSCRRQISEGRWRDAPYATAAECPEHIGFDNAATDALNQWRFAPGVREGVPVTTLLNVRVDFSLR